MSISPSPAASAIMRPDVLLRDRITRNEATQVLGCLPTALRRHVANGSLRQVAGQAKCNLLRAEVEELAMKVYDWRKRFADPLAYWVPAQRAADILGVSQARLRGLTDSGRIPSAVHSDGTRLFRRQQLESIARRYGAGSPAEQSG